MTFLSFMYVAIGGAFGAMCRYALSTWIGRLNDTDFPFASFILNITASFLFGLWIGVMVLMLPKSRDMHMLIAVGALGSFAAFSSFSFDSYMLIEKGLWAEAVAYMAGSVVLSVGALFAGMWILRSLNG